MEPMNDMDACQWQNKSMLYYKDRLNTYEHWPKQMKPNQYQLAKAGFYYTGEYDKVRCFCCNLTVFAWEQTDNPLKEHERLSSSCMYVQMIGVEPIEVQPSVFRPFGAEKDKQTGFRPTGFGSNSLSGKNLFVKPFHQ